MTEPKLTWEELGVQIVKLVRDAGEAGSCKSCGASIFWLTTKAGKSMPVNHDGRSHFATCPNAQQHRKKGS